MQLHDEKPPLEAKPAVHKTLAAAKNESASLVAEMITDNALAGANGRLHSLERA